MNLVEKIAAWTEGKIEEADLVAAIESAGEAAAEHRSSFGAVVEDLSTEQQERCAPLIDFAFSLLDTLDNELQEVLDGLEANDRDRVIVSGDMINRASFNLNQTFSEFRNQALAALGPTDIPNLNHMILVKNAYVADPSEANKALLQESIDVERTTALQGARDLVKEEQLDEVVTLTNAFMDHLGNLNSLSEDLADHGAETDFDGHFVAIEMGFQEIKPLLPITQVALRAKGETEFPDLNFLLSMIRQIEAGLVGDQPLVEALQAVEAGFTATYDTLNQGLTVMESALAKEEIEAAIRAFDVDFKEGVTATYRFLAEREGIRLTQARGFFLDFAKELSARKERLRELEENEGKVTCPRCATINEFGRQRCSNCGIPLPQNVAATTTSTFQTQETGGLGLEPKEELLITSNLVKLYEAVNAIAEGKIEDSAFLAEIDKFETLVNAGVNTLPAEPTLGETEQQDAVAQVYDAFEEGVEHFRQGAELLRSFVESRDQDALKRGVSEIDKGAKKVSAAGQAVASVPAS